MRNLPLDNGCASRVGLTPSPTCLPGQGGSRKGMRPFGNETGRAIVSPPRSNRWRVFVCRRKGKLRLHRTADRSLRPPAFRGATCQSSHVFTWPGLTVGTDRHNRLTVCRRSAGAGHSVQAAISPRGSPPWIESHARCRRRAGATTRRASWRLAHQSLQRLEVGQVAEWGCRLAAGRH